MATATGDIEFTAAGQPNTNPVTLPAELTGFGDPLRFFNEKLRVWDEGGFYTTSAPSDDIVYAEIEIGSDTGDSFGPTVVNTSGNGIYLQCRYDAFNLYFLSSGVLGASIGSTVSQALVAGDLVRLTFNNATGDITVSHNGTSVSTRNDTTYSDLRAGYFMLATDFADVGASSWAAGGYVSGPSITAATNPTVDGAQSTITTDGLTGTPTATLGGYSLTLGGTLPNLTYTTDIASITANGPVSAPRIGESLTLSVTGDEGTATSTVATQAAAGMAVVTLAGTLANETDSLIDGMQEASGLTVAVPDVIYYPTADNTDITATGALTTDSESFTLILIQGGSATTAGNAYAFTVTPEAVTPVDPPGISVSQSVRRSITSSLSSSIQIFGS